MSGDLNLEQRYRRVLRVLPGYYRDAWAEDMVAAFLDSWLTGDPEDDDAILEFCKPTWPEIASVGALAIRLYLNGVGMPRRSVAWVRAVRNAVLVVTLVHAMRGVAGLVVLAGSRRLVSWLPGPAFAPGGSWSTVWYAVGYVWIVIFVMLVLGHYRVARVVAALAIVPYLVAVLQGQLTGTMSSPFGPWAYWILINLVPVLAMSVFRRDAPPVPRRPWLLALPALFLLVGVPLLAAEWTGNFAWVPDFPGLCCLLIALACLIHAPRAWSRRVAGSGVWSLTWVLLAALAGVYRAVSLGDYLNDPHLVGVSLTELAILVAAVALVVPDAVRTRALAPAPQPHPRLG
jgi:hypothetical protein